MATISASDLNYQMTLMQNSFYNNSFFADSSSSSSSGGALDVLSNSNSSFIQMFNQMQQMQESVKAAQTDPNSPFEDKQYKTMMIENQFFEETFFKTKKDKENYNPFDGLLSYDNKQIKSMLGQETNDMMVKIKKAVEEYKQVHNDTAKHKEIDSLVEEYRQVSATSGLMGGYSFLS
jgi:tryptophanyl-tRNA synthetase